MKRGRHQLWLSYNDRKRNEFDFFYFVRIIFFFRFRHWGPRGGPFRDKARFARFSPRPVPNWRSWRVPESNPIMEHDPPLDTYANGREWEARFRLRLERNAGLTKKNVAQENACWLFTVHLWLFYFLARVRRPTESLSFHNSSFVWLNMKVKYFVMVGMELVVGRHQRSNNSVNFNEDPFLIHG